MSDRGIPYSYRHMHGFGSHTFSLINAANERFWVKFHLVCQQGIKTLTDAQAEAIVAKDRESNQRDLYNSIENGDFPRWKMCIQAIPEKDAAKFPFNPFDLTKVWSHKDYPLVEVGMMELNRNPENYFAEVEQAAFNPANIVPGIGFSPDKMLQGRLFSYGDAQRYRLGVNHQHIRSTRLAARSTAITATARCGSTATTAARSATNPTATASGSSNLTSPNRRSASRERPTTGTIARTTTTTTRSPGFSSA